MPGVAEGYRDEQRDADTCGIYQPRSCAHVDLDPAESVGIASSSVLEGKKFTQIALGVQSLEEALLGPTFVGSGGYWVVSSGNVTDEAWKEYIKNQKPPEPDDDFDVV